MVTNSRRQFLKGLTLASGGLLFLRGARGVAGNEAPFEVLVVGDSLIWGQGLPEQDKTYSLVTDWLRREHLSGLRNVDLKVKAHSGATITFAPGKAAGSGRGVGEEDRAFGGEVNLNYPSMWRQVEIAASEYKSGGNHRGADLVMLTAGITDLTVEGVLDPFEDSRKLVGPIQEVCRDRVSRLLDHIVTNNPNALVAVIGYYPIISPHSSRRRVFNGWLDTLNVPGVLQPLVNNPLGRALFFRRLMKNAIKRSRVWLTESDRNLRLAVDAINARRGRNAAVFVPAPLTEQNAAEAPQTMLFRIRMNGKVEDPLFATRTAQCKSVFKELKERTGEKQSFRRCSLAAVGHPNAFGSRLYADAVIAVLKKVLRPAGQQG